MNVVLRSSLVLDWILGVGHSAEALTLGPPGIEEKRKHHEMEGANLMKLSARSSLLNTPPKLLLIGLLVTSLVFVSGCTESPSTPVPPQSRWEYLLTLASDAARKVEPNPTLVEIGVSPYVEIPAPGQPRVYGLTLNFEFIFEHQENFSIVGPSVRVINVELHTRDQLGSLTTRTDQKLREVPTTLERQQYVDAASKVKIGPEEVLQKTLGEATRLASEQGQQSSAPLMVLLLGKDVPARFGVPAVWSVTYLVLEGTDSRFILNAETGDILEQQEVK